MRIGLDIMGGDFAPVEAINGIAQFLDSRSFPDAHVVAIGSADVSEHAIFKKYDQKHLSLVPSTDVIQMNEHPVKALREKPNSSISIGFGLLSQGKIDAFISAGNTGAMLVGASHVIKPIEGVLRPTIPTFVPRQDGSYGLLLDVGLNADCKPENLLQFALLGSSYAHAILGIQHPRVGLLNIGEEEGKGNLLCQASYPLLKESNQLNFIGNIEGRDVFLNKADVIVCEGFVGNIILKMAESFYDIFHEQRKIKDAYLDLFNYELYGGTPVLGIPKPLIVGHGISHAPAFDKMLGLAAKMVDSHFLDRQKELFT